MRDAEFQFGAVAIGRNEGDRLKKCLGSLSKTMPQVVYVDSGSADGSSEWAHKNGVDVMDLDPSAPFTAARARNAGFDRLNKVAPNIEFVQFIDGDCEITDGWPKLAMEFMQSHPDVGVVCGRLRELHPEHSIYNWLCEHEWNRPPGRVRTCGGIAMIRARAFRAIDGYREDLIAGEDPELCVRMRAAGWDIWRLDQDMATHDAAMTQFSQWWRRTMRGGYAFAQGAYLHGAPPESHFVWETRRTWLWGVLIPALCLLAGVLAWPWGLATFLIYPLQVCRLTLRGRGTVSERAWISLFNVMARFPEALGQLIFLANRIRGTQARLIEHKRRPDADRVSG